MKDITSLLQRRAGVQARVAELAAIEADGTDLTAEQLAEFNQLQAEFNDLTARIDRIQAAEKMAAVTATPLASMSAVPKAAKQKGEDIGMIVRALCASKGDPRGAAHYADTNGFPEIAAVLNTGTGAAGGFIVPPGYVPEFVELLQPMSVVRASGARTIPMPNGSLTMPKIVGGASANYQGENDDIAASEQTFGQMTLSKKKLTALVPVSNDLIRFSNPQANTMVRDDMLQAIALREDIGFLRDNGTGNLPKGLRYWAPAGNVIAANATVNLQNVKNDLGKLELALLTGKVRMIKPGWVFSPRTMVYLQNLVDGNGNKAFPEIDAGQLRGKPFRLTTQIPENLGAGSNESEIYLVDFNEVIIGEATGLIIDVSTEASFKSGATMVSAFSQDLTLIRAITEHDIQPRHDVAVAVLTGVKWAP
ncbi:phage major capsid protein [Noviherbaspirillum cavernae]|uniref:Phage major capsid protein n=1 Tax=Noviherbaspirillum cavernae TaxID=2320862 RepID=A0A418X1E2_9BURK|nr:phage major capsid protein [Noviherbaspirillum cavernae]RJG06255.1 phage major capsid protein [Noviherbaspirillum cavernae]